jgi:integrase
MAKRGVPFHPDAEQAYQLALRRIRTYQGSKPVFNEETRLLVQGIVIDALIAAPQPVTGGWVHTSLMTVGGLTRWAWMNAEPLERGHLLSTHTRNRFLNLGCRDLQDASVNNYRTRLDLIATALSGTPVLPSTTRTLIKGEPVDPHTADEIATLWVWAHGLRPATRRDRVIATLVLGLGCGLRSSEHIHVRPNNVTVDADGVHVTVLGKYGTRLVTCDAVWEARLLQVVANTPDGHPLSSPWRQDSATARGVQNAVRVAQQAYPPSVRFSPRSLRNTWLVTRLSSGTPIPTLLDAAGVESIEALKAFLPFVTALTAADRAQALRAR